MGGVSGRSHFEVQLCAVWYVDIFKTDTEISRSNGSGLSKELQVSLYVCAYVHVCSFVCFASLLSHLLLMMMGAVPLPSTEKE